VEELFKDEGFSPDARVAEKLGKNKKTLKNWDRSAKMLGLGWPLPLVLNRIKHRPHAGLREFLRRCAEATINRTPP
jgi:hypothetical protein